jgi:hypothetical protein
MFGIVGDPDDGHHERDEKDGQQAAANHHLCRRATLHDGRLVIAGLQSTCCDPHVRRGRRGVRRRRPFVYGAAHIGHLAGER